MRLYTIWENIKKKPVDEHCYPTKKENAEDFWKRFEPVATAEYIRCRMNLINTAVNLVGMLGKKS